MSKELITHNDFTLQLAELDKIQETCKKLLATKHYQAIGEAGIHAIMARAKALGIHPFEALNGGFYVVQGRVGMSTEMMAALIRKRGHSITKDPKSNNECVILHGKRADNGDTWTCTFTRGDAEAAGLWNSSTWKKYPGVMLYNRCMSMLFRQLFPDLSLGAGYVEDELKEIAKQDHPASLSQPEMEVSPTVHVVTPIQKIDDTQLMALISVVDGDQEFTQQILDFLKIEKLADVPAHLFERIMKKAIARKNELPSEPLEETKE